MYTDRGNVLYDVLLPLCEIRIFMGAARMLSLRSTPKTALGPFGSVSPIHGRRAKNLEAAPLGSRGLIDDEGDEGDGSPGCPGPGTRGGVDSSTGVRLLFSRHSSSADGRPAPRRREKRWTDLLAAPTLPVRQSLELTEAVALPSELMLGVCECFPAVRKRCCCAGPAPESFP